MLGAARGVHGRAGDAEPACHPPGLGHIPVVSLERASPPSCSSGSHPDAQRSRVRPGARSRGAPAQGPTALRRSRAPYLVLAWSALEERR